MWTYVQRTGDLLFNGAWVHTGYSGHGSGKNNPDQQEIHSVGPIPRGEWLIEGYENGQPSGPTPHGPFCLRLSPKAGTQTFGRSGFLMHGDSLAAPGIASEGCIIMPREVREMVWASGDRNLTVVEFPPAAGGTA